MEKHAELCQTTMCGAFLQKKLTSESLKWVNVGKCHLSTLLLRGLPGDSSKIL